MAFYPNTTSSADQVNSTTQWITKDALRRGDIIAVRANSAGSRMIRATTNSPFSHLILYLGNGLAIDAMPDPVGVKRDLLSRKLQEGHYSFAGVFRHRSASDSQLSLVANWAGSQINKPYDNASAARVGLQPGARTAGLRYTTPGALVTLIDVNQANSNPLGEDASFMCSELVFRAFQVAGIPLSERPAATLGPGSVLSVSTLAFVGRLEGVK
ncbi:hypothetical protein WH50_11530 [Pokkaliibacter plantistimulans]|uniref:Permuted papain-like amidase YaeF/Yiix C92 family enzyme n=1 Tax=Pokkaliibacter plantistimulans TaxID=1635171 RepID=A0ABX5LWV6_9GAMM|nr:hypothetical protein [Pokkaliibacter plantistimulans]PXF31147.1 hypothetical protein WH50_11530 [Pokkaliibacter plantistimulans]